MQGQRPVPTPTFLGYSVQGQHRGSLLNTTVRLTCTMMRGPACLQSMTYDIVGQGLVLD